MRARGSLAVTACIVVLGLVGSAAYTVRSGDTVSGIAGRHGVPAGALVSANRLLDADHIRIGQQLVIPFQPATTSLRLPSRLLSQPERLALVPTFRRWAAANAIPADLLMAMTWLESGWQSNVVSSVGAMGIGQLTLDTVRFVRGVLIGIPTLDPRVPGDNIRMSARFLRWLLQQTRGDVRTALASYYQGLRSVFSIGPYPSTVAYVDAVLSLRPLFA